MAYTSWSVVFGEQPSAAKWNILGTNDASFNDGTGIAVSAITPEKLLTGTGTTWVWQTWSPTWTNVSGGATTYAKYIQVGKAVFFRIKYTLAGAGVAGDVIFSTPTTIISGMAAGDPIAGTGSFIDAGTQSYGGMMEYVSSTTVRIRPINAAGTYTTTGTAASSTVPFTFGNTDTIIASGLYEAA